MEGIRGLAAAAAELGESPGEESREGGEAEKDEGSPMDPELEAAMVDMAGEYRKALAAKDDKALAHVMVAMFECCASMAPSDFE